MIEVTLTLYPRGDRAHPRKLGRGVLINDGTGTRQRGNYTVGFVRPSGKPKCATVRDFPRLSLGAWNLLARALKEAGIK